jgi:hypothetical protein
VQGKFTEAFDTFTKARDLFISIGDTLGMANCIQSLGQVYQAQSHPGKATTMFRDARDLFMAIGSEDNAENCSKLIDDPLGGIKDKKL